MDIRSLKHEAQVMADNAKEPPRKIVFLHTVIALGASAVLGLISLLLELYGPKGSGLSGLGTRAVLSTAQVVLQLSSTVLMPFWSAGLIFAMLGYARGDSIAPRDLVAGFRRFRPVLSSGLMMGLQYLSRGMISAYLSGILVMVTPFAKPAYELVLLLQENPDLDLMAANVEGLPGFYAATMIIFLLVFTLWTLPVFYRYRMVNYRIMDEGNVGGLKALLQSRMMMHQRRWKLFRLDLSFWWFYGLELLLSVLPLGAALMDVVGIGLPIPSNVAGWLLQLLAAAGRLALYTFAGPKLELTYALCYRQFLLGPEPPKPKKPVVHPWTY